MKKFILKVAQNGGEYYGHTTIKAHEVKQLDYNTVVADGIEIKFDEFIESIKESNY